MSFTVINALSYALQTIYHDIDTTTIVLDVLFIKNKNKNLICRKTSRHPEKMFRFIYPYIFQNKVKLSSGKIFLVHLCKRCY